MNYRVERYTTSKMLKSGNFAQVCSWFALKQQHIAVFGGSNPPVAVYGNGNTLWIGRISDFNTDCLGPQPDRQLQRGRII